MFHDDRPIRTTTEDLLDRKTFAVHLAQAICQWGQREGLVIALNGEWGSGKSSIINMTVSHLEEKPEKDSIPTIIRFNPWIYSDLSSLTAHFFQEISQTLNIPNSGEKDKKLAEKIKLYASLLEAVPDRSLIRAGFDKVVTGLGLLGVSAGAIPNWFGLPVKWFNILLFAAGAALLLLQITRGSLAGLSRFLENRSRLKEKTAIEVKKDIESELLERDKKLLIIIDDLDRLTGREMVEMFRLIKANADFPNTIYLLAFDKGVVASHLDAELKTSGSKYLEKIVQVAFDVPQSGKEDVKKFFNEQLQRIAFRLPESAQKFMDTNYWSRVYNSAIQHYLTNLRIVKRYLSSLEFNMMQLCSNNTMEVHPVDFIALEAIRQFEPEFFHYLKQHKELFTSVSREANNRRNEIYQRLGELIIHKDKEKHLIKLIEILFPQIGSNVEEKPEWSKELMVRSPIHFDSYFAYLPKGSSSEISQAELETVLEAISDRKAFEDQLQQYVANGKIGRLIPLLKEYADDRNKIASRHLPNIIMPLLDIAESNHNVETDVMFTIFKLFEREQNSQRIYSLLFDNIMQTGSLYALAKLISFETITGEISLKKFLSNKQIRELQLRCAEWFRERAEKGRILEIRSPQFILSCWKKWDSPGYTRFIENILLDDGQLLHLIDKLRISFYASIQTWFPDPELIREKLTGIQSENSLLYQKYRDRIDSLLATFPSVVEPAAKEVGI